MPIRGGREFSLHRGRVVSASYLRRIERRGWVPLALAKKKGIMRISEYDFTQHGSTGSPLLHSSSGLC